MASEDVLQTRSERLHGALAQPSDQDLHGLQVRKQYSPSAAACSSGSALEERKADSHSLSPTDEGGQRRRTLAGHPRPRAESETPLRLLRTGGRSTGGMGGPSVPVRDRATSVPHSPQEHWGFARSQGRFEQCRPDEPGMGRDHRLPIVSTTTPVGESSAVAIPGPVFPLLSLASVPTTVVIVPAESTLRTLPNISAIYTFSNASAATPAIWKNRALVAGPPSPPPTPPTA